MDTAQRVTFAGDLLVQLGAPATPTNVAMLVGWMAREGTTAANNPLATTLPWPGATIFNSAGVRNYASHGDGVDATARTLTAPVYAPIVFDLRAGDGAGAAQQHHALSTWSGGGYDTIELADLGQPTPPAPAPAQPEGEDMTPEQAASMLDILGQMNEKLARLEIIEAATSQSNEKLQELLNRTPAPIAAPPAS